jgi:uncharacterized protein
MHALTLIIKVTRRCNLRCTYCNDWRPGKAPVMTRGVLDRLLDAAMMDDGSSMTAFAWHGGEPTLVPIDFYRYAIRRQEELAQQSGRLVANLLQTNAVHLSGDWLDLIEESHMRLGVSLDGPRDLHDRQRPTVAGRGSFAEVRRTLDRLRARGIPFSTLMVLTEDLISLGPEALWTFLVDEGLDDVDLIPARPPNTYNHPTIEPQGVKFGNDKSADRWATYMAELFDLFWTSSTTIRINSLDSLVRKLLGASGRSCITSGSCMGQFFGIEPTGEVYVCGLYEDVAESRLGSVLSDSFREMRAAPALTDLVQRNEVRLSKQRQCGSFDLCAGGCPHDAFLAQRYDGFAESDSCCGWSTFTEHVRARVAEARSPSQSDRPTLRLV